MILDTSFILDLIEGDDGAVETVRQLEQNNVPLKVPAMTRLELYIGVETAAHSMAEKRRVQSVIGSLPSVEMDAPIAERAGRIVGELLNDELTLGKADAAIAAAALVENEPVLTRNVDDFERVPNLDVATY